MAVDLGGEILDAELDAQALEGHTWKSLGEDVCSHVLCGTVLDGEGTTGKVLANEEVANVYVLASLAESVILDQCDGALVVFVKNGGFVVLEIQEKEFVNEATEPDSFLEAVGKSDEFGFAGGE